MPKPFRLKLNIPKARRLTSNEIIKNMRTATVFARDQVKLKLNRGQPTRVTKGGTIIGLDPSVPGEPPKKITSQLQNSLLQKVVVGRRSIHGLVGSSLKKAAALELGNRKGTLKPRPYFRPALMENRGRLARIIAKGHGGF